MKTLSSIFYLFLILSIVPLYSQESPTPEQINAWEQFRSNHGEEWNIRWSDRTGAPRTLYMGLTEPYYGTPEEISIQFLIENAELYRGLNQDDLRHMRTRSVRHPETSRTVHSVRFQQLVDTIPVEFGDYLVVVRDDGRVRMAKGMYHPPDLLEISRQPVIDENRAYDIAVANVEGEARLRDETEPSLVFYPAEEELILTWKISLIVEESFDASTYYVSAIDGAIVHILPDIIHTTGTGNVYPTHPGLSSVTNESLPRLNGNGYLQGLYVDVYNWQSSEAFSANHEFNYSTSNNHFDEVNVYYHVDKFRHEYIGIFEQVWQQFDFGTIDAYVRDRTEEDGNAAWYQTWSNTIHFGDGPGVGYNNFAREDKVVYHEYLPRSVRR